MEIATIQETLNKDQGTNCPACGHFAGVYENCPRCGTHLPKRTSLKFFKYFSLVLGIGGLFFLYLWVLHRDLPKIQVKNITETMNFAYVEMSGTVTKEPRVYTDENKKVESLSFSFNDGTGEIRAMAYRHNAQKLIDQKKLPRKGDYIQMKGQLKVKADQNVNIMLQAAEQFIIKKTQAETVALEKIDKQYLNKDVTVQAKIESIRLPREGSKQPVIIELSSAGKKLPLVMWKNVYSDVEESISPEAGMMVYAYAYVKEHQNRIQLQLQQAQDIRLVVPEDSKAKEEIQKEEVLPENKQNEKPFVKKFSQTFKTEFVPQIQKITAQDKEKWYQIEGTIVDVKKFSMGQKILVKDSTGKIEVILWDKSFQDDPVLQKVKNGVKVKVAGRVDAYKDKLQLHPAQSDHLEILGGEASQNVFSSLDKITKDHIDQTITLKGKVLQKTKLKPGTSLLLGDDTGKIGVMLWDRIFKEGQMIWNIEVNKWIQVTGSINEHKGKLQIQPLSEEDIKILDKAPDITPKQSSLPEKKSEPAKDNSKEPKYSQKNKQDTLKEFKEVVPIPEEEKKLEKAYLDFVAYTTKDHIGKIVPSSGFILEKETIPNVGVKFVFQDRSGRIDLLLPQERFQNSPYYQNLDKGYGIWMQGKVIEYQGKLMLQPRGDADFKIESLPGAKEEKAQPKKEEKLQEDIEETSNVKISEETVGQTVTIKGKLLHLKDIKGAKRLVVAGNFGKIDVILAKDIFDSMPLWENVKPGNLLKVTGQVKKFQERFEIKPEQKDSVQIVLAGSSRQQQQEEKAIEIAKISDANSYEGKKISLKSTVIERQLMPAGFEASLRDDSGMVKLFAKESLLNDLSKWKNCTPGSKVQVIARVNKGRDRIQLDLQREEDFQLLEKGETDPLQKPAVSDQPAQDWSKENK